MNPSAIFISVVISLLTAFGTVVARAEAASPSQILNFDRDQPGTLPDEFTIGTLFDGRPAGNW